MKLKNKKVTVMGLGIHGGGEGLVRFLTQKGARVLVSEIKSSADLKTTLKNLSDLKGIKYEFDGHKWSNFKNADMVFLNPAVKKESLWVKKIQKSHIPISSEMNLFFQNCPGQIIGVTGTNGKSTVAHLIYEILKNKYQAIFSLDGNDSEKDNDIKKVYFGGNIGGSLLKYLDQITKNDLVLLELSSFQLYDLAQIKQSPHISIILNITPDHLDQHVDFSQYFRAKMNILKYQKDSDFAILNYDQKLVRKTKEKTPAHVLYFSQKKELLKGAYLRDDNIMINFRGKESIIMPISKINIPGKHNISNVLVAALVGALYRINPDQIANTISNFSGLEHRIEFVKEKSGIKFYNDSKATTPDSTIAAIKSFKKSIILIAGGKDKNTDFSKMAKIISKKVKYVYLIGETASKIKLAILKNKSKKNFVAKKVIIFKCLKDALSKAYQRAKKGNIILLSPGCSSLDQFISFEQRGDKFKKFIDKL